MYIAGIICEYNPFHTGHAMHIAATRERLGNETAIFCVMSGNFVQRGMPAIMQKHIRAEAAIRCGADLVAELPLPWAISSAERFSEGGIGILRAAGLPMYLSFGSECGDIDALEKICGAVMSDSGKRLTSEALSGGLSYAAARQAALDAITPETSNILRSPNNLLGVEYIKAIKKLGAPITPMTIARVGADHDGAPKGGISSASHIRLILSSGGSVKGLVPDSVLSIYEGELSSGRAPVDISTCEQAVLYRLRTMSDEEYQSLPDATEGLWARFSKFGRTGSSLSDILESVKSKRYAMSRIRRMALAAYLGVTSDMSCAPIPYIRVLSTNSRGKEILKAMKNSASVPIITKPASAKKLSGNARRIFELEARATDIYSLMFPDKASRRGGTEWTQSPIIL